MTIKRETKNAMFDSTIRAEMIIHIGCQMIDDALPSYVRDVFNDCGDEVWEALGLSAPDEGESANELELSDYLCDNRKQGYLVQFATPVPKNFNEGQTMWSVSWGHFALGWVYGNSMQECCEKALEWRKTFIRECEKLDRNKKGEAVG